MGGGGEVFYTKKVCSKFEKNRSSSFCRILFTDFEKLVFRKTRLKFSTLSDKRATVVVSEKKEASFRGSLFWEFCSDWFEILTQHFWNVKLQENVKKKSIFRICLSLTPPPLKRFCWKEIFWKTIRAVPVIIDLIRSSFSSLMNSLETQCFVYFSTSLKGFICRKFFPKS